MPGTRTLSRLVAAAAVLLLGGVGLVLGAVPAAAHTELTGSTPADGATVEPPAEVVLEFNEAVATEFAQVAVLDDGETSYATGQPVVDGRTVTQAVAGLPDGPYDVSYRIISADGHPVSGTLSFTVAGAEPAATATPEPAATPEPVSAVPEPTTPAPTPQATEDTTPAASTSEDDGLPTGAVIGGGVAVAAGAAAAVAIALRRPGTGPETGPGGTDEPTGPAGPTS